MSPQQQPQQQRRENPLKSTKSKMFNKNLITLALLYATCVCCCCNMLHVATAETAIYQMSANTTATTTRTPITATTTTTTITRAITTTTTAATTTTNFVPHRFSSHNNITILHEVHSKDTDENATAIAAAATATTTTAATPTASTLTMKTYKEPEIIERPLVLNTHEVLPTVKPAKPLATKKPYLSATLLFDKPAIPLLTEFEQKLLLHRPLEKAATAPPRDYELHPVTFDFNLGDLEDLEHETIKKGDLSAEEQFLLRNAKNEGFTYADDVASDDGNGDGDSDTDSASNGEGDDGAGAAAAAAADNDETALGVTIDIDGNSASNISALNATSVTITTTATATAPTTNTLLTVEAVGPHIFKVGKNAKATKKGRELLKQEAALGKSNAASSATRHNSISRHFATDTQQHQQQSPQQQPLANGNLTLSGNDLERQQHANEFQMLTNLYDHFYWQASEIRTRVSTGCGLEMQAYLMALHGNYEWAQRAYDASGRYRGQLFYGNDKWLGAKTFCHELNHQLRPDERKHFEFEFYMATIAMRHLHLPQFMQQQPFNLYVGECLPRSCTADDVQSMLTLDPHAHMLNAAVDLYAPSDSNQTDAASGATATVTTTATATTATALALHVAYVRNVPGNFSYWRELKFQLFASFMLSLLLIVATATWYQAQLNQRDLHSSSRAAVTSSSISTSTHRHHRQHGVIPAISAKLNGNGDTGGALTTAMEQGKAGFELYQMRTITAAAAAAAAGATKSDYHNAIDMEANVNSIDVNGNNGKVVHHQMPYDAYQQQQQQQQQQHQQQAQQTQPQHNAQINNGNNSNYNNNNNTDTITNTTSSGSSSCDTITTTNLHTLNVKVAESVRCATPAQQQQQQQHNNNEYEMASDGNVTIITYEQQQQQQQQHLGMPEKILLCFAFQTNASTILNIDAPPQVNQTSCVHGLRVISVLWTIMVHTYLQIFSIGENRFQRVIVERSMWYQIVGNATFSVDTFFFISGFLVTLLFLKHDKKYPQATAQFVQRSAAETLWMVSYRYIRLTPAYFFVILFTDFSLRQSYDGAVFPSRVALNTCGEYWWRNILYINNFYPLKEICMIWSWYMANDMQFYIMATMLLLLSTRYFKAAVLIVLSFLLSSWGISGIISLHYQYTHKVSNPFESFDFLYDKPWQRVGTYIMGMLAGYILHKVKKVPHITQRTNRLLWLGSVTLLTLIIFGVWDGELSILNTAFYVSIGHTAFGLSLIWIVLSCCWGLSPTVNRILSYRGLLPLSRLTYCTYLIHPVIMLIITFRMGGPVHLSNLFVLIIFLGNAVLSFGIAFIISVLLEAPIIRLLKIVFKK